MRKFFNLASLVLLAACNAAPNPDAMICDGVLARSGREAADNRAAGLTLAGGKAGEVLAVEYSYAQHCMRRWSYRLGKADASIDDIVKAVAAQCNPEIQDWKIAARRTESGVDSAIDVEATNKIRLFIIKGRAGSCAVKHD